MLFSSMTFIYVFLPIVIFLYYICGKKMRNIILLLSSIIFYGWADAKYLIIIFSIIFINYFGAILISSCKNLLKKPLLFLTVFANLSFLFYFKYFNFFITNINNIVYTNFKFTDVVLPIGISFYTFQALSYLFDVYREKYNAEKNLLNLSLYICLFPQLVAGPIIKYHEIADQIKSRIPNFEMFSFGLKRFIIGLSKKVIIANSVGVIADKIFCQNTCHFSHGIAWLGSIAYTLQIYFDFSGYSDMAIGLGMIFGFKFAENFNYPYISRSLTDFWHRWHMSLSGWFKEYLYVPLGGNKNGKYKTYRNLGIVFLLTGIWHGASWTFVIWGLWHGCFIILEKIFNLPKLSGKNFITNLLLNIYTMFVVIIGWVIFRSDNLQNAKAYISNMLFLGDIYPAEFEYNLIYYVDKFDLFILIIAIILCTPIFRKLLYINNPYGNLIINISLICLFIFSTMCIASNTYNPFIYFRF